MRGILIDLGGVLIDNDWRAAARSWGDRLGVSGAAFLAALLGGSDDPVMIGRVSEQTWFAPIGDFVDGSSVARTAAARGVQSSADAGRGV